MLTYTLAGFGSRVLAAIADTLILGLLMVGLAILVMVLLGSGTGVFGEGVGAGGVSWGAAVFILMEFALMWGYFVAFEGLNDGQTPGKRMYKLRVVRDGGYSVTFAASAVRNLVRVLDAQPGILYAVGGLSVLLTKSGKRLGDILAGTFVVHEGKTTYDYGAVPKTTSPVAAEHLLPVLRDSEYDLLERFIARRSQLETERRRALTVQVATQLARHLDPEAATQAAALVALFDRERMARAASVAGRSDTGTQREQHAIIALGVPRWNEFGVLLETVRKRGLQSMTPAQVSDFIERYRQITADLASLQTAARGRTFDALFFVSRLVAGGHAVLYRGRGHGVQRAIQYVTTDVPQEIRRSAGAIGLAALMMFGPAIASYIVVVREPETASSFLPPRLIERADSGQENIKHHRGYVTIKEQERPIEASLIIANNVRISYMAFALGVTGGLGTLLLLVFNGVQFGGAMGVFAAKGIARLLLAFVAPHGVLELSAICLAGGGGFLIASAMVLPRERTRREAFVIQGRRAVRLVAGATLFLAVAGTIEGLISPRVWPIEWKVAVSMVTAVAMIAYIALGWRDVKAVTTSERGAVF